MKNLQNRMPAPAALAPQTTVAFNTHKALQMAGNVPLGTGVSFSRYSQTCSGQRLPALSAEDFAAGLVEAQQNDHHGETATRLLERLNRAQGEGRLTMLRGATARTVTSREGREDTERDVTWQFARIDPRDGIGRAAVITLIWNGHDAVWAREEHPAYNRGFTPRGDGADRARLIEHLIRKDHYACNEQMLFWLAADDLVAPDAYARLALPVVDKSVAPEFEHDCDACRFLGKVSYVEQGQTMQADAYLCARQLKPGDRVSFEHQGSLIVRIGDDGPEYTSSPLAGLHEVAHQGDLLDQAYGLLIEAGRSPAPKPAPKRTHPLTALSLN